MTTNLIPEDNFSFLDQILIQQSIQPLSLNPEKNLATSLAKLGILVSSITDDKYLINQLRNTLEQIVYSLLQNFPENIFWDFDFMVFSMFKQALLANSPENFLEYFGNKIVSLIELFGAKSIIKFRYIHDFMYGFDWAKWVQKDPLNRAHIQPFDLIFLDYLLLKGRQIIQQISLNQLPHYKLSETGYRNPFSFSREIDDEYLLLTSLAKKELIPVPAWHPHIQPIWNKAFQYEREELSLKLNIRQTNT